MIRPLVLLCGFAVTALPAAAQTPGDSIARAGATGIYVWLGGTVVSDAHPVDGTVAHRVERRREGSDAWTRVADVAAVADARAFFAPLDSATRGALRAALHAESDAAAWAHIVRTPRADSLSALLGHETIRLALGFYALDRNVRPGERWQYRVSRLDARGGVSAPVVSAVVGFPAPGLTDSVHVLRTRGRESGGVLWWRLAPRTRIRWLEIWRRRGTTGAFARVDSVSMFLRAGDSVLVTYRDGGLPAGTVFQYYALPRGFFFNPGPPSDTVTLYTVDDRRLAVPDSLVAAGDDSLGISLTWRLPTIGLARTIRVWRSAHQDTGWYRLAELPGDARRFEDDRVRPMTLYYYRLTVLGLRGEESPPTGAVFAYFRSARPPEPPALVRVEAAPPGLRVTWTPNREPDLRGYFVYRSDAAVDSGGIDTTYTIVSPLVPAAESSFVDSAASPSAGRQWRFVVRAVNTSDRLSGLSNPATPPAGLGLERLPAPPAPAGLRALVQGRRVRLVWDAVDASVPNAAGYEVGRRTVGAADTAFRPLTASPLPLDDNALWDSTVTPGASYDYSVRVVTADGRFGARSAPARAELIRGRPAAPADVRARVMPGGIEVTWGEIDVAGTVRVYRASPGAPFRAVAQAPADSGRYVDPATRPGERYFYVVTLTVDGVESGRSAEATARR